MGPPDDASPAAATGERAAGRTPRGRGSDLRDRLIEAATALIDEHGEAGPLTIRAVTRRAGVSPMALYLHFPGLGELVDAAVEAAFGRFLAALVAARDADPRAGPRERLLAMGVAYLRFAREQTAVYSVIFGRAASGSAGPADGTGSAPPPPKITAREAFDALVDATEAALPAGEREEARLRALGLWTGLHGFVTLATTRPRFTWPPDDAFAATLLERWVGPAA